MSAQVKDGVPQKRPRLSYLDWLRVLATILIIIFHFNVILRDAAESSHIEITPSAFLPNTLFGVNTGAVAVSVFFILSGASLMYVYESSGSSSRRQYFIKRYIDIFPRYYSAYLTVVLFYYLIGLNWSEGIPAWKIVLTVIGMDGYSGVFGSPFFPNFYLVGEWFVGCLLLMYLIFLPLKTKICTAPRSAALIVGTIAVVGYYISRQAWPSLDPSWYATSRLVDFSLGMYFIHYIQRPSWQLGLLGGTLLGLLAYTNIIPQVLTMSCAGLSCFLLFGWLASLISYGPVNKAVEWLSAFSYSAFLIQHVVIVWVINNIRYSVVSMRVEIILLFVIFSLILLWGSIVDLCGKHIATLLRSVLLHPSENAPKAGAAHLLPGSGKTRLSK